MTSPQPSPGRRGSRPKHGYLTDESAMKILLSITGLFVSISCFAQENRKHHVISAEIFGLGLVLSGNYDYLFGYSKTGFFDVRAGFGAFAYGTSSGASFPHALTYNFGQKSDHLEIGLGGTLVSGDDGSGLRAKGYAFAPVIGYRRVSVSGFHFRLYTMVFTNGKDALIFGGIGAGKAF